MSITTSADIFRHNLRGLIQDRGLTQRQAAEEIGVDYLWLRKVCAVGISKPQVRTKPRIEKIRAFFGIGRARLLWSKSLRTESRPDPAKYSEHELLVAIELLSSAFRLNPRLRQVRLALKAIERASNQAGQEQRAKRMSEKVKMKAPPPPVPLGTEQSPIDSDTEEWNQVANLQALLECNLLDGAAAIEATQEVIDKGIDLVSDTDYEILHIHVFPLLKRKCNKCTQIIPSVEFAEAIKGKGLCQKCSRRSMVIT
jgi:hypothetical protein